jgi:4-azaleucine resistance transporter AzlC
MSPTSKDFGQGVSDIAPVLIAVVPIGLLWGTLAAGNGLSVVEALLMSILVFAGASQFVALEMWAEPVPILLLVFTAFIVNIRHVLMSASISRHVPSIPRKLHPLVAYFLVDESWALGEKRALGQPLTLAYFLGTAFPLWVCWNASTFVGAALGKTLGDPAAFGIDFAFSAMFIAILMGFWNGNKTAAVLIIAGFSAALAKLYVPGAWYIVIGGVAGALCAAALHSEEEQAA